jgi:hypothetical protein
VQVGAGHQVGAEDAVAERVRPATGRLPATTSLRSTIMSAFSWRHAVTTPNAAAGPAPAVQVHAGQDHPGCVLSIFSPLRPPEGVLR